MCFHLCSDGSQVTKFTLFFSHKLGHFNKTLIKFTKTFFCDLSSLAPVFSFISSNGNMHNKASGALKGNSPLWMSNQC